MLDDYDNNALMMSADQASVGLYFGTHSRIYTSNLVENALIVEGNNNLNLRSADKSVTVTGKEVAQLGMNDLGAMITVADGSILMSSTVSQNNNVIGINWNSNEELTTTIGRAYLKYNSSTDILQLSKVELDTFIIQPKVDISSDTRVQTGIYIGTGTLGSQNTFLKPTQWKLSDTSNSTINTTITPSSFKSVSTTTAVSGTTGAYITTQNSGATAYATLFNGGKLELHNQASTPIITFKATTSSDSDVTVYKTRNEKTLNINADKVYMNKNLDVEGDITAGRVFNAVYNDVAEFMEKANYAEDIQEGDVVVFTEDGKVTKPNGGESDAYRVAGIVSSKYTYGYVLGGEGLADNEKVPVALCGRVYLNIGDLSVQAGDLIALNNSGSLYIASEYTRNVIGKATGASEEGKVFVLVK